MPILNQTLFDETQYFALADALLCLYPRKLNHHRCRVAFSPSDGVGREPSSVVIYPHYFLPEINTLIHGLTSLGIDVFTFDNVVEQFAKCRLGHPKQRLRISRTCVPERISRGGP